MISLTKPDLREAEIEGMIDAVRLGGITAGDIVARFEKSCAQTICVDAGVATNSGTSALVLALATLDIGLGDEVIVPSYTCVSVLHAIVGVGAKPILVDSNNDVKTLDFNLVASEVAKALTPATQAIIVPHMFGTVADVVTIKSLGVPVIEDISLAFGAVSVAGDMAGTKGDLVVCSFHGSKMLACGEGGMLLGSSQIVSKAHEKNGSLIKLVEQRVRRTSEPYRFQYGFRMSDIHAACGEAQIGRLKETIALRRALAARYTARLGGISNISVPDSNIPGCVYYRYIVQVHDRKIVSKLNEFSAVGIEVGRGVFPPLHMMLGERSIQFPNAHASAMTNLSLPLYPALGEIEIEHVLESACRVLAD